MKIQNKEIHFYISLYIAIHKKNCHKIEISHPVQQLFKQIITILGVENSFATVSLNFYKLTIILSNRYL